MDVYLREIPEVTVVVLAAETCIFCFVGQWT